MTHSNTAVLLNKERQQVKPVDQSRAVEYNTNLPKRILDEYKCALLQPKPAQQ